MDWLTKWWRETRTDLPKDLDEAFVRLVQAGDSRGKFSPKVYTTYKVAEYLVRSGVPGDLVECGVYRGRHIAMMAATLKQFGVVDREIYLYDTFAGMTEPGAQDTTVSGHHSSGENREKWNQLQRGNHNLWCYAPLDAVQQAVFSTGYPRERFHFVQGDIRKTVPNAHHRRIALLRLDTDWYELTRHELEHLYDLLIPRGVLIIDDYGSWAGARQAVDEFFAGRGIFPLLLRTDRNERVYVKLADGPKPSCITA